MNLNIEYWTRIVFIISVACSHPSHPPAQGGTCCQRVNCVDCRFWMSTIMSLRSMGLLGFAWLFVSPHSVFVHFWLTRAPQCLAYSDCPCSYKPVIQMVSTFHRYVSVYILGVSKTCGVNGMLLSDISLLIKTTQQPSHSKGAWLDLIFLEVVPKSWKEKRKKIAKKTKKKQERHDITKVSNLDFHRPT